VRMTLPDTVRSLLDSYGEFEQALSVVNMESELRELVRFNGNKALPIHRWFVFKEGFSAGLLFHVCERASVDIGRVRAVLDPFAGVGTSLVDLQLNYVGEDPIDIVGIEYNPLIAFVAKAKTRWPEYGRKAIQEHIEPLLVKFRPDELNSQQIPSLSSLRNRLVFRSQTVRQLLALRGRIMTQLSELPERDFFLLAWLSIIDTVSGVRKDGRALRYTDNSAAPPVLHALASQLQLMLDDLAGVSETVSRAKKVRCHVIRSDGRVAAARPSPDGKFDLVYYSPPYPNNIDYSEVYKLELWLSRHVGSVNEFRKLRLGTLRSHPSVKFPETRDMEGLPVTSWAARLRRLLLDSVPKDRYLTARRRTIGGYLDDMYRAIRSQFDCVRPGAPVIIVIGNSMHGRPEHPVPIAADLLLSSIAMAVGFDVERIEIARNLRRRANGIKYLRESVLFLRRP